MIYKLYVLTTSKPLEPYYEIAYNIKFYASFHKKLYNVLIHVQGAQRLSREKPEIGNVTGVNQRRSGGTDPRRRMLPGVRGRSLSTFRRFLQIFRQI